MHRNRLSDRYRTFETSRAVRHPRADYSADLDIHVVIAVHRGRPFEDAGLAREVCQSVEVCSERFGYRLYGYCLMPDHLHVLLSPGESGVELGTWLQRFKSYTAHWAKRHRGMPALWQRSCYDHVCRDGETAEHVLRYILDNPVKEGLTDDWRAWPWSRALIDV
jgi:REP element-mobilizing transposase RayT